MVQEVSGVKKQKLAAEAEEPVLVDLGDRSYPIVFQPLAHIGEELKKVKSPGKCVLVSNTVVGPLHSKTALESLKLAGWSPEYYEIPDGEKNKNAETYLNLVNKLLDFKIDRKTPVIALGGGVTTDIVGFAAATTLRGIPFANIPTTLLAMVDASVGGKTGVNTAHGKNLLGAFWQPILVHAAVDTLETLDDAELRCGLGEVIKHGVLNEVQNEEGAWIPSNAFMDWIEENGSKLAGRDPDALKYAIRRSCEIKAAIVKQDERESGKRALLNLGHTVGHAIENVVGYGTLRHGEAVAIGTIAETQLALLRGKCKDDSLPERIAKVLRACSLPTGIKGVSIDELMKAVLMDKKREASTITVTVPISIGNVALEKMKPEDLRPAFEKLTANVNLCK
mmetsp:Transcript_10084/g.13215  ORF Transcript_10084/g.13215 Transcript_10084/m.13215 type:complete len:394 (+) Transcript_10084:136-1317(+)